MVVGIVVFAVSGNLGDPLFDCLLDTDYNELLSIVEKGLPNTRMPQHVAIIGGGMAGLTAAKYLEQAGHKVQYIFHCWMFFKYINSDNKISMKWHFPWMDSKSHYSTVPS